MLVLLPILCSDLSDEVVISALSNLFLTQTALLLGPYATLVISTGSSTLFISKPFPFPVKLLRGECLGCVQPIDSWEIINVRNESSTADFDAMSALNLFDSSANDLFSSSIADGLSPLQRSELLHLLCQFHNYFDVAQPAVGHTSTVHHHINTGSNSPLCQ